MVALTGSQIRDSLLLESGVQLRNLKRSVENASQLDLTAYWDNFKLPPYAKSHFGQVVNDSLIGGQLGRKRVAAILSNPQFNFYQSIVSKTVNEIISLLAPKAHIVNWTRFRVRCVRAHLENLQNLNQEEHLQGLDEEIVDTFQNISNKLQKFIIHDEKSLDEWVMNTHTLIKVISDKFPSVNNSNPQLSSRLKKGFIAKKNLPTYFKHWNNFTKENLSIKLNFKYDLNQDESINKYIAEMKDYKKPNIDYVLNQISVKNAQNFNSHATEFGEKEVKEIEINGKKIIISNNASGIDKALIQPLIDLFKIQMKINDRSIDNKLSIKNLDKFITIEATNFDLEDLPLLQKILTDI
jgi:hypothetical protein